MVELHVGLAARHVAGVAPHVERDLVELAQLSPFSNARITSRRLRRNGRAVERAVLEKRPAPVHAGADVERERLLGFPVSR